MGMTLNLKFMVTWSSSHVSYFVAALYFSALLGESFYGSYLSDYNTTMRFLVDL